MTTYTPEGRGMEPPLIARRLTQWLSTVTELGMDSGGCPPS